MCLLKDLWGSVLLFQVGAFRQLMNEAFSVWDSKYLTGKFRKICSVFSRPPTEGVFPAVAKQKTQTGGQRLGNAGRSEELCPSVVH